MNKLLLKIRIICFVVATFIFIVANDFHFAWSKESIVAYCLCLISIYVLSSSTTESDEYDDV